MFAVSAGFGVEQLCAKYVCNTMWAFCVKTTFCLLVIFSILSAMAYWPITLLQLPWLHLRSYVWTIVFPRLQMRWTSSASKSSFARIVSAYRYEPALFATTCGMSSGESKDWHRRLPTQHEQSYGVSGWSPWIYPSLPGIPQFQIQMAHSQLTDLSRSLFRDIAK